jgi:hypothetical protein
MWNAGFSWDDFHAAELILLPYLKLAGNSQSGNAGEK